MITVWERIKRRAQHRRVRCIRLPLARSEVLPSFGALQGRRPDLEVSSQGSERAVDEEVDAAFETFRGESILDRGNQTVTPRAVVDVSQDHLLCRDGRDLPARAHKSRWTNRHS